MTKKPKVRVQAGSRLAIGDSFANFMTGLGQGNPKVSANTYVQSCSNQELDTIYDASTWFGKIVDIPAEDATREWRSWQTTKENIEKLEEIEKNLRIRDKVLQALIWSRLYGGAALVVGGLPGMNHEPLILDRITKGSIKFVTVLPKHEITALNLIRNPMDELYGYPEMFSIRGSDGGSRVDVHPSRVIPFNGRKSGLTNTTNGFWGESIWNQLNDSIMASDAGAAVIHALLHEAKVDVIKQPNLMEHFGDEELSALLLRRYQSAAILKSIANVLILDGEDEWDQKQIEWGGLPNVIDTLLTIMCGAADIPKTRLLGVQQAGLSGADNGSIRNYYDSVKAKQELYLSPQVQRLDEMLMRSALGQNDNSIWFKWNPLWQPTEKERAEVDKLQAEAVNVYATTGLVPDSALSQMVQNRLIESSSWPGADTAYDSVKEELSKPRIEVEEDEEDENKNLGDAAPRTLYVYRRVLNAHAIIKHFKDQGFKTTLPEGDMHVTIAYSRTPVDWMKISEPWEDEIRIVPGGARLMEAFGPNGEAKVLIFNSSHLAWRHEEIKRSGATWDWPDYQPHVTISFDPEAPDLSSINPYIDEIILGPELFEEVKDNWSESVIEDRK